MVRDVTAAIEHERVRPDGLRVRAPPEVHLGSAVACRRADGWLAICYSGLAYGEDRAADGRFEPDLHREV